MRPASATLARQVSEAACGSSTALRQYLNATPDVRRKAKVTTGFSTLQELRPSGTLNCPQDAPGSGRTAYWRGLAGFGATVRSYSARVSASNVVEPSSPGCSLMRIAPPGSSHVSWCATDSTP